MAEVIFGNEKHNMKNVKEFSKELSGAYSTNRYNNSWVACIRMLRKRQYNDEQIEAIICSKWTRWAADCFESKQYTKTPAKALANYLDGIRNLNKELVSLVIGIFEGRENNY
jgi:hypothetical protein